MFQEKAFRYMRLGLLGGCLIIAMIFVLQIAFLSCNKPSRLPKTYIEAYDQGSAYLSKGEVRGFLVLYSWMPKGAKQCFQLAANSYTQALAIESKSDQRGALSNRAVAYTYLEEYDNALNDYLQVLEINAGDFYARLGIARVYEKSGQLALAALKYEEAIQFMKITPYWVNLHPDQIAETEEKLEIIQKMLDIIDE